MKNSLTTIFVNIYTSINFFQNISQKKNQNSHTVLVGMKVWCIRLCPTSFNWNKVNTTEAACVDTLLVFCFSQGQKEDTLQIFAVRTISKDRDCKY